MASAAYMPSGTTRDNGAGYPPTMPNQTLSRKKADTIRARRALTRRALRMRSASNSCENSRVRGRPGLSAGSPAMPYLPGGMLLGRVDPVDAGGDLRCGDAVEVQRDHRRAASVGDAVDHLLVEIAIGELAGAVDRGLAAEERGVELLLGQLALGDAVDAPHLVAMHRAGLARQPGDRGDDEAVLGVDVEEVPHIALRIPDPVLGS